MISLVLICKNEQDNLYSYLMHHAKYFDDIVIVDDESTDNSIDIINKFKLEHDKDNKISLYVRPLALDFAAQRNFATSKCSGKYVLHIDADERMTVEFLSKINGIEKYMDEENIDALGFPRCNFVGFVQTDNYPDTQVRLIKNDLKFVGEIHEHIVGGEERKVIFFMAPIFHFSTEEKMKKATLFYMNNFEKQRKLMS